MLLFEFRDFLLEGLLNTLLLSGTMVLGGTFFAVLFAAGLFLPVKALRALVYGLVEILRDIPLMVTVLLVYFVLPNIGLSLDPFWSSALSVSVWGGANGAHIIRAGLLSVPKGQREAARAFGLRGWKGLALVIVPQAMPVILPPYVSLVTGLVQASSLGAVIGAHELFRAGQVLIEQTTISQGGSPAYLVYGLILVVYFVLCWVISFLGRMAERYFNRGSNSRRKLGVSFEDAKAKSSSELAPVT
jgi:polar amino acid transport system permease protein